MVAGSQIQGLQYGTVPTYVSTVHGTFYVQPAAVNKDSCDRAHTTKILDIAPVAGLVFVSRLDSIYFKMLLSSSTS